VPATKSGSTRPDRYFAATPPARNSSRVSVSLRVDDELRRLHLHSPLTHHIELTPSEVALSHAADVSAPSRWVGSLSPAAWIRQGRRSSSSSRDGRSTVRASARTRWRARRRGERPHPPRRREPQRLRLRNLAMRQGFAARPGKAFPLQREESAVSVAYRFALSQQSGLASSKADPVHAITTPATRAHRLASVPTRKCRRGR